LLSPTVFLFGELLPKDLFRRRPHILMRWSAPVLAACRVLFWPLAVVLGLFSRALEQFAGLRPAELAERPRRDEVLSVLAEGRAVGALEPHAEELAHNALKLRSLPVTRAMIPWNEVYALDADLPNEDLGQRVRASAFTRLPVVRRGQVEGYVHQLAVLADGGSRPILEHSEAILCIAPELSVDRALSRLRHAGRRMAVVGQPEAPLGLVTLKDLLEEISGDLGGW
jgi:CBS domain containing-hemolysin-like protein